jgi:phosphoribosylformylglycinamidine synthase
MGAACVDEAVRQAVCCGADPDRVALLDNFCVGNPDDRGELGRLVETCKGMAEAALAFGAPFISGKDSFYNYFETDEGPVSIPVTLLVSALGVVGSADHVTGASLRREGSYLYLLGEAQDAVGGSVYARVRGVAGAEVPATDAEANLDLYRRLHRAITSGLVLAAHDVSEGGLGVTLAEMGFSMAAGLEVVLPGRLHPVPELFGESPGQIVVEVAPSCADAFDALFAGAACVGIGGSTGSHRDLVIQGADGHQLLCEPLAGLKLLWKNGLTPYY